MQLYQFDAIEKERLNPKFARQVIHGDTVTIARVFMSKGCVVPMHSHVNEQLSLVEQGALQFELDGKTVVVRTGEVLQIPPHLPHSAVALEDTTGIDFFAPIREDWRNGNDAYLRQTEP